MAMASTGGQGTAAEAMLFRQLMRTAQAIHDMHRAVEEARRAAQIRDVLGARLDQVRARLPEMATAAPAATAEAVQRASSGTAPARPGSPLPSPLNSQRPAVPAARPRPPERGTER